MCVIQQSLSIHGYTATQPHAHSGLRRVTLRGCHVRTGSFSIHGGAAARRDSVSTVSQDNYRIRDGRGNHTGI